MIWCVFLFTNQFLNANKPFVKFRSRIRGHPWISIEPNNLRLGLVKLKWAKLRDFWIFLSARKYLLNKHYGILYAYSYSRTYVSSVHFMRWISRFPSLCCIYALWNNPRLITFPENGPQIKIFRDSSACNTEILTAFTSRGRDRNQK